MAKLLLKHNAPINAQTVVCSDSEKKPVPMHCSYPGPWEAEPRLAKNHSLMERSGMFVVSLRASLHDPGLLFSPG